MKIFIIGATGFIGKNLTTRMVGLGHDVICGVRSFRKLGPLLSKVKKIHMNLEDGEGMLNALKQEKPDVVYHCAALVKSCFLPILRYINVQGTRNVLEGCRAAWIKNIIYLSSVAVISGNTRTPLTEDLPYKATNPYGRSKLEAEKVALEYREKGLNVAILRPCMVYGGSEPHNLGFIAKALKRRLLPVFGNGNNRLHLVSVENVVDVMALCLSKHEAYEGTYIIADKEALSMKEIFNYMAKVLGARPPVVIPEGVTRLLAKIPLVKRFVRMFLKERFYSIERLEKNLGYTPRVSVRAGLKKALSSYI